MGVATGAILGGAAIGAVGNYLSNKSASDRAQMLQDQALQEWIKVNIPDPEEQQIALQRFVDQGELDPKLEKAITQKPSEFNKIVTSQAHKGAQNRALAELESIGLEGGLRLQDKAALQDAMLEGQVDDRANRQAIASDMARRGMSGSGFDVAAQLSAQQGGADRDARNSLQIAAGAQDRALESLLGAGDMATKFRSQDFGEQADIASANDAINRFNTSAQQDVQQRNTASQNRAAEMNLEDKQRIADANTNLSNEEQKYNKSLLQQKFENEAKIAAGKSGQYNAQAGTAVQQGQQMGNVYTNLGQGISGAAAAQANKDYWSDYLKKNKA